MNFTQQQEFDRLMSYKAPRWEDLPLFDLYMDQTLAFLNKHFEILQFDEIKPELTAAMVNNYVKNSIVKPPVKKHYKTYHLAFLYIVMLMKRCFSLSEISEMIQIYSNIEDPLRTARDYNKFVSGFEECLKDILTTGSCAHPIFENPTPEQKLMVNVIRTIAYKFVTDFQLHLYRLEENQPSRQ